MEMPGIEPGAFHMQSERSTTELHPLMYIDYSVSIYLYNTVLYFYCICTI